MKKIYTLALAAIMMSAAQAQDIILNVAEGTSQVKVTLPAGEYTVNEQAVTSNGKEIAIALNGATEVSFKRADGNKVTAFTAVNQPAIVGVGGSGSGMTDIDLHGNSISKFDYKPSSTKGVLRTLYLNDNQLSDITFTGTRWGAIEVLDISDNDLSSLGVSAMTALRQLYCSNNRITSLSLTALPELTTLWCDNNAIKSLNINANTKLESIVADNNAITKLTAPTTGLPQLVDLWLSNNELTTAAVKGNTLLYTLNVADNNLTSVSLDATDKKMLFADFTGNQLTFSSLYSPNDILNYLYGNQQKFSFAKDVYVQGETVDMPEIGATNLSGTKLSLSTKWYNWETDESLKQGSKSGGTGDYYAVSANKQYVFKPNFKGLTYATVSTSSMPGLVMRSHGIRILDENEAVGVDRLQEAGFTFCTLPNALQMSSDKPINVRVSDINGRIVWSGTVDSHGIQVDGLSGLYIVNGLKITI